MKKLILTKSLILPLLLTSILLLEGCKKDTPQATYKIHGLWVGTVTGTTTPSPAHPYSLSIKTDGKLTFEGFAANQYHFGIGTWTLNGNTFTANVTTLYGISSNVGTQQQLTATFNSANGTLSNGAFINTSPATGAGVFSVTKVN